MIYIDLLIGLKGTLDGCYKYLLVIINNYTCYLQVYGFKDKNIKAAQNKQLARVIYYYKGRKKKKILIKQIRSNNRGEFILEVI